MGNGRGSNLKKIVHSGQKERQEVEGLKLKFEGQNGNKINQILPLIVLMFIIEKLLS